MRRTNVDQKICAKLLSELGRSERISLMTELETACEQSRVELDPETKSLVTTACADIRACGRNQTLRLRIKFYAALLTSRLQFRHEANPFGTPQLREQLGADFLIHIGAPHHAFRFGVFAKELLADIGAGGTVARPLIQQRSLFITYADGQRRRAFALLLL